MDLKCPRHSGMADWNSCCVAYYLSLRTSSDADADANVILSVHVLCAVIVLAVLVGERALGFWCFVLSASPRLQETSFKFQCRNKTPSLFEQSWANNCK